MQSVSTRVATEGVRGHTPTSSQESEDLQKDLRAMVETDPRVAYVRERVFFDTGNGEEGSWPFQETDYEQIGEKKMEAGDYRVKSTPPHSTPIYEGGPIGDVQQAQTKPNDQQVPVYEGVKVTAAPKAPAVDTIYSLAD